MSKRSQYVLAAAAAINLAVTSAVLAAPPAAKPAASKEAARLATYDKASGATHFALSLTPPAQPSAAAHEIVVLVDTSASQTGIYRDDSLAALQSMLDSLGKNDRVKLVAVDVDAIALTDSFVAADSAEMTAALAKLKARTPLGSTDLVKALHSASNSFANSTVKSRAAVYIGDGVSKAQVLGTQKFAAATEELVANRVPVTTYAIGPDRDLRLLAALANQTGGNLYIDTEAQPSAQEFGLMLAKATSEPVFFPNSVKLPAEMASVYPKHLPPLRADRDSIVIGSLENRGDFQVAMQAEVDGRPVDLTWTIAAEASNPDFAFLPQLVEMSQKDGGVTLPTVGSAGLREAGRALTASAQSLTKLSGAALASGDKQGAKVAAEMAIARDPENQEARVIRNVALQDAPAEEPAAPVVPRDVAPPAPMPPAGGSDDDLRLGPSSEDGALLREVESDAGVLVTDEVARRQVQTERIRAQVENELIEASRTMGRNPQGAQDNLKLTLQQVEAAPELDPEVRLQLRNKLETAIRESRRLAVEVAEQQAQAEDRAAAAQANQRLVEEMFRKEERIRQLMVRFETLMDEGRFRQAEDEVAEEVRSLQDDPTTRAAVWNARFVGNIARMRSVFERRAKNFVDMLAMVEESHIPFPDEPPIVYPDPAFWEDITLKRKKYASVDLAKSGSSEERIYEALAAPARNFEFFEAPLTEAISRIKEDHEIPIVLDEKALADAAIGTDTLITKSLKGITLRSALKLMLKDHALSYAIRDEVLIITTQEQVDTNPDYRPTKVYPVADLVLPISNGVGANPFQLGGGLGGQGGFGGQQGGGFGGQQGGFGGGGGFGGQQGGGVFAVEDELSLGDKPAANKAAKAPAAAPAVEKPQVIREKAPSASAASRLNVVVEKGQSAQEAWDKYLEAHPDTTAEAIRETARVLMKANKYDETAALIQAALKNGHAQSWMYEALSLALQAKGADSAEIERTLMSAVDFAGSGEEMMLVAAHMVRLGLDQRALNIYRDVSTLDPLRPEPYMQGLEIASRLHDIQGIQWACAGVLSKAWLSEDTAIQDKATRVARATLLELHEQKRIEEAKQFESALNHALVRDCVVRISWTGDADIDLMVEEPAGTICSFRSPRSTAGGVLVGESLAKANSAEGHTETYICPEGFSGQYRMLVKRVWGKVTAGKVTVDIYTNYNTDKQKHIREQIPLGDKDALVMFDVPNGRRKEALAEQQVANVAKVQMAVGRAVLAQQLDAASSRSDALQDYAQAVAIAQKQGRWLAPPRRNAVGYRPVITTLPEGANMTATAVISADRRYVRITAVPFFSLIGEVQTFNFSSGAQSTSNTGGAVGGAGGNGGIF